MSIIYKSENFLVVGAEKPDVDRKDGGHIDIYPKARVSTRQELSTELATELMKLTMVVGEAMTKVLIEHGVDIGRINYQDNGNWTVFSPEGPMLHVHIYGRAKSAKTQAYGQALRFPHRDTNPEFYESNKRLTQEDIEAISEEVRKLLRSEKYSG